MGRLTGPEADQAELDTSKSKPLRADAQRSEDALLEAALAVFATSGVDAPVREIAEKAGVGIATLYRRFPQRADLIVAVFRQQVDACAKAAVDMAEKHAPTQALTVWIYRYADFIATKRGLAGALRSGDAAFSVLPAYFKQKLQPALQLLLDAAVAAGEVRANVDAYDILRAVANLSAINDDDSPDYTKRMIGLLIDGLRFGSRACSDATT